ncbi:MAG: polyphosphate kinase 1, partial [Erysipelotrichaceae bacterium]|nr:polyphosphate kinase 1 [Erysipelotrichaceae bacterium]
MKDTLYKQGYTQGRELSWLKFNDRVLNEAKEKHVPLLERLNFLSIYSSNLREYFMVRVGSMNAIKDTTNKKDACCGQTVAKQLESVYKFCAKQQSKQEKIYKSITKELRKEKISILNISECSDDQLKTINKIYNTSIKHSLSPRIVNARHPLPNLASGTLYVITRFKTKNDELIGIIPLPSSLPTIYRIGSKKGDEFVLLEDIMLTKAKSLFGKGIEELETGIFEITRNADVNPDQSDDDIPDYRKKVKKALGKRRKQEIVRLRVKAGMSNKCIKYLMSQLNIRKEMLFVENIPLDYSFGFTLPSLLQNRNAGDYQYAPYTPKRSVAFDYNKPLFDQVLQKDVLLHYPYESMDPFLQLVKEAAKDPRVLQIKITIYRLAKNARLVDYLCEAAENGKEVIVLIELKARFDEQNNIDYSARLEDSGCTIMYGFENYKVHSKICQITRIKGKRIQSVTQIGTGNFNEKTVKLYTDLSYITADKDINKDAADFFNNMLIGKIDGQYHDLWIGPAQLKDRILQAIDKQIALGPEGTITVKINSITDTDIMERLSVASQAGVPVNMIVRGICCLLPQVEGKTDNIHIRSIVGRYLEHSRIYVFGKGEDMSMY